MSRKPQGKGGKGNVINVGDLADVAILMAQLEYQKRLADTQREKANADMRELRARAEEEACTAQEKLRVSEERAAGLEAKLRAAEALPAQLEAHPSAAHAQKHPDEHVQAQDAAGDSREIFMGTRPISSANFPQAVFSASRSLSPGPGTALTEQTAGEWQIIDENGNTVAITRLSPVPGQ